jgi:hypothetical protein
MPVCGRIESITGIFGRRKARKAYREIPGDPTSMNRLWEIAATIRCQE